MSGGKRGDYQNCSVLYCVLKLCTVISTLRWAVLAVLFWIGFCHTGPISRCIDSFVFMYVYFVYCVLFILYYCNTVGWIWWDWSIIVVSLGPYLPSVLWHSWLGHHTGHLIHKKPVPDITCDVFGGTLNLTQLSVCLYVCQMITSKSLDVGSSLWHMRYISREYGSGSYMKGIGSRWRSQEQKRSKSVSSHCGLQLV